MRKFIPVIILVLLCTSSTLFAQEQKLQQLISRYGIPGIQLIHIKGGKTQTYNLGTIDSGSRQRLSDSTVFEAASLSKCVFSYIVMRLYDRGLIGLDTPLIRYTGKYDHFDPVDRRYAKITARMVLRHTTGLPNWGDNKGVSHLIFTPDSTFSYSGEGFMYLQRAAEKITGKSLNELAQQEVFTPLNMVHSSFSWTDRFDKLVAFGDSPAAVKAHQEQGAAFSLLTCAHDYALFLQALITGKGLKPGTHRMMFEKQSAGHWFRHSVGEAGDHIWWGLGVGLQENEKGLVVWHWGDNGDFKAFFAANPNTGEILVYLTHSNYGLHPVVAVLNIFFPQQTWWAGQWIGYQFKELDHMNKFWDALDKQGYDHAGQIAAQLKSRDTSFTLTEDDVNDMGFILLRKGMKEEAVDIFGYNASVHPESSSLYDSLGEGYEALGETSLAIKNFKKAVAMNPQNTYAAGRIEALEANKDQ
jgi:CubicO group peptidase (beta-lactamase class C family)